MKQSRRCAVIPLHLPLGYPCDYIEQTARVLSRSRQVILFDFRTSYSWKMLIFGKKLPVFIRSVRAIARGRGIVGFTPLAVLPFQQLGWIRSLNTILGVVELRLLLAFLRRQVITWSFSPVAEPVAGRLGEHDSVYDCVDYYGDARTPGLRAPEAHLMRRVRHVAFNSAALAQAKMRTYPFIRDKSAVTVCGCDAGAFGKKSPLPREYGKGKKAVLTGHFDYRLDTVLLDRIMKDCPEIRFYLIGPVSPDIMKAFAAVLKNRNACYLGAKPKAAMPAYMRHADIGLIPYDIRYESVRFANPMKAYEYLASGIPVVSTWIRGLSGLPGDIVSLARGAKEFGNAMRDMTGTWSDGKARKAQETAAVHSWENKVGHIMNAFHL